MTTQGNDFSLLNKAQFSFDNYLTSHQQTTLHTLVDSRLKEIMLSYLLPPQEPQDLTKARLALDIIASCSDVKIKEVVDLFFLTILNTKINDDPTASLVKLRRICQVKDGAKAFFQCASTKKINYYTIRTLKEIIDQFFSCLQPEASSISSYLYDLPCYDEGGAALFTKIIQNSAISRDLVETVSTEHIRPYLSLDDLLAKSIPFKSMQAFIFSYLNSLPETHRLKQDVYNQFFDFLQNNTQLNALKDSRKSELLKIMVVTTSDQYHPVSQNYTVADLKEMAEEACGLHAECGEEVFISFYQGLSCQKYASLDKTIQALKLFHSFFQNDETFSDAQVYLKNFQKGVIKLAELIQGLEQLASIDLPPLPINEDVKTLMGRFEGNDPNVQFALDLEKLKSLEKIYSQIQEHCIEWQHCRMSELINKANQLRQKATLNDADLAKLIAIGRLALRIKFFPIYLHPTQVLTVLGLLSHSKGCIAQVKTGEGKSMIVALLAFVLSMQKRDVHIISSSPVLAQRDQIKFDPFFREFGITSSHICRNDRKPEHFEAQLIYGTANDYEFAIMEEMLHFNKIFSRTFENAYAIVDEVDNLTIDTALHGARFGYPAETAFNWVYLPIFKFVQQNIAKNEKEKLLLSQMVIDLKAYLQGYQGGQFRDFIEAFSNDQLQNWLSAAYHALYELEENKNYIIEQHATFDGNTKLGIVIIDDKNTGKRMEGCRWSGGIHEFVEVKHHIEMESETITPISMSHPVFYPFYPIVYGLTGTIGSKAERDEIKEIYSMDSFDVPTYQPPLRHDAPPLILQDDVHYMQAIVSKIATCREQGRPILVLCKTIHDTLILEQKLKIFQIPHDMLNEKQQKKEEDILESAGLPGAVTIATNNAGRGTDIQLKGSSKANGGLHVLITFYPESLRVEEQARGRAGRQGEPGSSEILLSAQSLGLGQVVDLENPQVQRKLAKKLAGAREMHGSIMRHLHICRADLERFCFIFMRQFYQRLERFHALLDDNRFLGECSRNLSNRLLNIQKPDFSTLHSKDRRIAEEAFKLLQETQVDPIQWIAPLKKAGERIKEKIINEWAVHFLAQVEAMIHDSKIQQFGSMKEMIRHISQQLLNQAGINEEGLLLHLFFLNQEHQVIDAADRELRHLKEKIQHLYVTLLAGWEKALDIQGVGIIDYLGHLLGVKLLFICPKPNSPW